MKITQTLTRQQLISIVRKQRAYEAGSPALAEAQAAADALLKQHNLAITIVIYEA